ncbi:MAG TPA: GAF domain-containing protein, partial [Chthonomonadales bacterium]|nr:GAF domain-containing protein [Chthonomonadales bacterium]
MSLIQVQGYLRIGVFLAAVACTLAAAWPPTLSAAGATFLGSFLLIFVRWIPVAATRERAVTFTAPVTFAIVVWCGVRVAAPAVLIACLAYSQFAPSLGVARGYIRIQGALLAVAAYLSGLILSRSMVWLIASPSLPARVAIGAGTDLHERLLAATALSALAFTLCASVLASAANISALVSQWRAPRARAHFDGLALVYAFGMLPVVCLSPLGSTLGMGIALPSMVLFLLCAHVSRLTLEVRSLRGQIQAAEAMGRASIADAEVEVDSGALLNRFLLLSARLVVADRAIVWRLDAESGMLSPAAGLPDIGRFAGHAAMFGEGLIGHAAARYRPRVVADAAVDPHRSRDDHAEGAWLLYPIVVHDRLLGVAHWIRSTQRPFGQDDIRRLGSLVPQAAIALENARVREAIHNLASTDGLT